MEDTVRYDCRFFLGDRPCVHGGPCGGCDFYSPMGRRLLVIKLAAAGDVLRATSVLPPLKEKYPDSHITWVADENALPLVVGNPFVDRALPMGFESWLRLAAERFDTAICLDKEPRGGALLESVTAGEKLGFGLTEWGTTRPVNDGARYDFELGLSNERKFHENERTYPEIFCEIAEVDYAGDPYALHLPDRSIRHAREWLRTRELSGPLVGLNVGAGAVFANKAWTEEGFAELARSVSRDLGGTAVILGGPEDRDRAEGVLDAAGDCAVDGETHELMDFAAIVASMDAVVTGDTMAMHMAIALRVPVVAILGPTVPQEIAFYAPGRKVISPAECAPCYRRECDRTPTCMEQIPAGEVLSALREVLESE
ncbi:MAG: glycosyltransferase family 9 protein [Candidatus Eisenbacteria bacterium]|nr:glycosyltransferase family 9 protein [Candidatus Eisenbacteria bacterium]